MPEMLRALEGPANGINYIRFDVARQKCLCQLGCRMSKAQGLHWTSCVS